MGFYLNKKIVDLRLTCNTLQLITDFNMAFEEPERTKLCTQRIEDSVYGKEQSVMMMRMVCSHYKNMVNDQFYSDPQLRVAVGKKKFMFTKLYYELDVNYY